MFMDNVDNTLGNVIKNKYNCLDGYIKQRLYEETGIKIHNKQDLLNLQKQHCILLYHVGTDVSFLRSDVKIYENVVLVVSTPKPDKHGVHYMTILDDIFEFRQNRYGRWSTNTL